MFFLPFLFVKFIKRGKKNIIFKNTISHSHTNNKQGAAAKSGRPLLGVDEK